MRARSVKVERDTQLNEVINLAGDYKRKNKVLKEEHVEAMKKIQEGDQRLLKL